MPKEVFEDVKDKTDKIKLDPIMDYKNKKVSKVHIKENNFFKNLELLDNDDDEDDNENIDQNQNLSKNSNKLENNKLDEKKNEKDFIKKSNEFKKKKK